jgi:hypothetical protein
MNDTDRDFGKTRFGWLLKQRGYVYADEQNLESKITVISKRPDYFVEASNGTRLLVEIESFNKGEELDLEPGFRQIGNYDRILNRVRNSVKRASLQLRDYKSLNIPLLIVLDNWRDRPLMLSSVNMREALFGRITFALPVVDTPSRFLGDPVPYHGRDQVLNEKSKCYISAVALIGRKRAFIYDDSDGEKPLRLQIFHNHFALRPLPIPTFSDAEDVHEGYDIEGNWKTLWSSAVAQNLG